MIIYKCIFPNNKLYIGQTIRSLETRISEHKKDYKNKDDSLYNTPFYRAIRKYGWNNLNWKTIDLAEDFEELNEKEKYWIKYYNSYIHFENPKGYNSNLGGQGNMGLKLKKETIEKIRVSSSGENSSRSILTKNNVLEIIELSKTSIKRKDIAKMFNVKDPIISKIISGKRWSSITGILFNSNQ